MEPQLRSVLGGPRRSRLRFGPQPRRLGPLLARRGTQPLPVVPRAFLACPQPPRPNHSTTISPKFAETPPGRTTEIPPVSANTPTIPPPNLFTENVVSPTETPKPEGKSALRPMPCLLLFQYASTSKYPPVAPPWFASPAVCVADELLLSCCRTRGVEALLLRASGHHLLFSKIDRHHVGW